MKRVYVYIILFFIGLLFLLAGRVNHVFAHGANYTIAQTKAMVIRVEYDDGEPMSYAQVKIFSPDDQKIEYQNGRTDKMGRFAFLPITGGEWKITVSDGMGHGVTAKISPENKSDNNVSVQSIGLKKWQKVIMALSIVWGFIGLAFFLQAKIIKKE